MAGVSSRGSSLAVHVVDAHQAAVSSRGSILAVHVVDAHGGIDNGPGELTW